MHTYCTCMYTCSDVHIHILMCTMYMFTHMHLFLLTILCTRTHVQYLHKQRQVAAETPSFSPQLVLLVSPLALWPHPENIEDKVWYTICTVSVGTCIHVYVHDVKA